MAHATLNQTGYVYGLGINIDGDHTNCSEELCPLLIPTYHHDVLFVSIICNIHSVHGMMCANHREKIINLNPDMKILLELSNCDQGLAMN